MRSQRINPRVRTGLALVFASALLAAVPAAAADSTAQTATRVSSGESVRVFRDPVTGELRAPTKEEREAMKAAEGSPKAHQPLAVKVHGGGMVSAVVGTRALDELVARRAPDGRLVIEHRGDGPAHGATAAQQREVR